MAWISHWLWLWHRPAGAAPILPLTWELPYILGVALKKKEGTSAMCNNMDEPGGYYAK